MDLQRTQTRVNLPAGALRTIPASRSARVRCETGTLWITVDGDTRDIVLTAGEEFSRTEAGPLAIFGLDDASYVATVAARPSAFAEFVERIALQLRRTGTAYTPARAD